MMKPGFTSPISLVKNRYDEEILPVLKYFVVKMMFITKIRRRENPVYIYIQWHLNFFHSSVNVVGV